MIENKYTAIWRAVVIQVITDLKSNVNKFTYKSRKYKTKFYINSEDFKTVCEYADLNYSYVLKRVNEILKDGLCLK